MDDNAKSEVLANFASLTGVDEDRARFYLESSNWNLEVSDVIQMVIYAVFDSSIFTSMFIFSSV